MNSLRIIHVLFSRGFAGTERSTAESCNEQCKTNEVTLICLKNNKRRSGASIIEHLDPAVNVVYVSLRILLTSTVQKIIDQVQPHVIHAHLRRATRVLAKCKTNAAKISTLHIGVNSPAFLKMDALIAISPWQLEHVPPEYQGAVRLIKNSLTPHKKPDDARLKKLRGEITTVPSKFIVGGVGRMSNSKGWDTLINAFSQAQLSNAVLVLIGEGRDEKKLRALAAKNTDIIFLGFKRGIKDYYHAFDVFVCPSREEPMGRVILEAIDAGTPVIASDIEGPKDILSEYPGQLFPVDDVNALSRALKCSYDNRDKPRFKPDLSSHYIEKINDELLILYRHVMAKKSR